MAFSREILESADALETELRGLPIQSIGVGGSEDSPYLMVYLLRNLRPAEHSRMPSWWRAIPVRAGVIGQIRPVIGV